MTSEQWRRVFALVRASHAENESQRPSFLRANCADDKEVLEAAQSLLLQMGASFEHPFDEHTAVTASRWSSRPSSEWRCLRRAPRAVRRRPSLRHASPQYTCPRKQRRWITKTPRQRRHCRINRSSVPQRAEKWTRCHRCDILAALIGLAACSDLLGPGVPAPGSRLRPASLSVDRQSSTGQFSAEAPTRRFRLPFPVEHSRSWRERYLLRLEVAF